MKKAGDFFVPDAETLQIEALTTGGWQLERLNAALEFVKDFSCAIDGGAHVGSWSRRMAKRFDIVGAFEPCADIYQCLRANLEGYPNVKAYCVALGEKRSDMYIEDDDRHGIGNTGGRFVTMKPCGRPISMIALDEIDLGSLGFLKLDVEGFEYFALCGAERLLRRFRPVVMIEDKARMAVRYGIKPHAAADFLVSLGAGELKAIGSDRIFGWL